MKEQKIGFIGQGFIGKNYADDFEARGIEVVRYALEEPYRANKAHIATCDIVFIAVPTPTTAIGFDDSIVREAVALVAAGKIAVLKSTILPGYTKKIQEDFPDRLVLYSPEFLSEKTAAHDAAHPFSNIVGLSIDDEVHRKAVVQVHGLLPKAPFTLTCSSTEAELIKYTHNASGYFQIVFFNLMYDLAQKLGAKWQPIEAAVQADPMICNRYAHPVHTSGHPGAKSGRGAGGHCFIKDFAALRSLYEKELPEEKEALAALRAVENENKHLLKTTDKDIDLLEGVYGNMV